MLFFLRRFKDTDFFLSIYQLKTVLYVTSETIQMSILLSPFVFQGVNMKNKVTGTSIPELKKKVASLVSLAFRIKYIFTRNLTAIFLMNKNHVNIKEKILTKC